MIPALFAEDEEIGEPERFAIHMRTFVGDYVLIRLVRGSPDAWGDAKSSDPLRLPLGEARRLLGVCRAMYLTRGTVQYHQSYHDLRLVGERSGDVQPLG